jgi:serine/threonine protein kinase
VVEAATGAERAVKVLDGQPDPVSVERFRREASALARLGGRGVVSIHSSGVEGNRLYFVMDRFVEMSKSELESNGARRAEIGDLYAEAGDEANASRFRERGRVK